MIIVKGDLAAFVANIEVFCILTLNLRGGLARSITTKKGWETTFPRQLGTDERRLPRQEWLSIE